MFEWLFGGKKDVERVEEETKKGFESVKKDLSNVGGWIKHLDSEKNLQKKELEEIKNILSSVQEELEQTKNMISVMGNFKANGNIRLSKRLSIRQPGVEAVQTAVQTAVWTPNLDQFSITEKAIIWILLNTDMKLSYDDLAAMMDKERSTIRTQINGIKQKNEIIEEVIEKNGKKRVFIPENIKEILLKKPKVRVKTRQKNKKTQKISKY